MKATARFRPIKKIARNTFTKGVLTDIGSFGACYQLSGFRKPVLISSADGVGTKLKVAFATGRHDTVGEDLVNHCVNDIAVQGAVPLFFLDYFAIGKLQAEVAASVVSGIARGCKNNGCALIGGETAEMPGLYAEGEYDLAGFIVGAAERSGLMTGAKIREGDVLLGLPSTGLHTNGYSLARKLLFEIAGYGPKTMLPEVGATVAERCWRSIAAICADPRAAEGRRLAARRRAHYRRRHHRQHAADSARGAGGGHRHFGLERAAGFRGDARMGNIPDDDYRRTFNLGVGMILAVPAQSARTRRRSCASWGRRRSASAKWSPQRRGRPRVEYREAARDPALGPRIQFRGHRRQLADRHIDAEIAVVISNRAEARGLEIARERGLNVVAIPSEGLDREIYDRMLLAELRGTRWTWSVWLVSCGCSAPIHPPVSEAYSEYSSVAAAVLSRARRAAPGAAARRKDQRLHGALCGRISGCGSDRLQAAVPVRDDDSVEYALGKNLARTPAVLRGDPDRAGWAVSPILRRRVVMAGWLMPLRPIPLSISDSAKAPLQGAQGSLQPLPDRSLGIGAALPPGVSRGPRRVPDRSGVPPPTAETVRDVLLRSNSPIRGSNRLSMNLLHKFVSRVHK